MAVRELTAIPQLTQTQRNALTTMVTGTVILNSSTTQFERFDGVDWIPLLGPLPNSARYYSSTTTISGTLATVVYDTQDYDSFNLYSGGTYTTGADGRYLVNAALLITGTVALNNNAVMEIQKNGTVISRQTIFFAAGLTDGKLQITDIINCTSGDTLRIQVSTTVTAPSIVSSNFDNYISIAKQLG